MASLNIRFCPQMVLLDKLLPKLRQEGHKILVFSQMVKMLDFISEYCEFRSYPYERLDGRVRGTERQKAIDRFEREEDSFLFLLSTRAGGVGINLTAAGKFVFVLLGTYWTSLRNQLTNGASQRRYLHYFRLRLEPTE